MAAAEPQETAMVIDGVPYTFSDLTFAEEDEYRKVMAELAPTKACPPCQGSGVILLPATEDGPGTAEPCPRCGGEGELVERHESHYLIAFVVVVKRRSTPDFSVDAAKLMKRADFNPPQEAPAPKPRRKA